MKPLTIFIALLTLMPAFVMSAEPVAVERVIDGDTFITQAKERVRLYGIDAPELDQPYGKESRSALMDILGGGSIEIQRITTDRYGRTIALAWSEDRNIAFRLLADGAVWMYPKYCRRPLCAKMERLEAESRRHREGLWAGDPIAPWRWRKKGGNISDNDTKDKVIRDRFIMKRAERSGHPGLRVLAGLPEQALDDLFQFIFSLIEWEIKYGLGRLDWEPEENEEEPELYWFQHIQNVLNECNKDCYFCDDSIDPNETAYGENKGQWICPECQLKLGSYLRYRGMPEAALKQLAPFSALGDRGGERNK